MITKKKPAVVSSGRREASEGMKKLATRSGSSIRDAFQNCQFYWQTLVITPEMAWEWLMNSRRLAMATGDYFNRPIDIEQVERVALATRRNQFPASKDIITLGLTLEGHIILDGQHRLAAIAISGQSVLTRILSDCPFQEEEATFSDYPCDGREADLWSPKRSPLL